MTRKFPVRVLLYGNNIVILPPIIRDRFKIMKKCVFLFFLACVGMMVVSTGCNDKKPEPVDTTKTDSVVKDTADSDTVAQIIAETPMPKAADQLFDDFFFNFIASPKVQRARINFPLPVTVTTDRQQRTMEMKRSQWKMDKFFRPQGYYTLIFDNENQMKLAKSTKLDSVIVERIHLRRGEVEQYWFDHQNGKWRMCAIKRISFSQSVNASFLKFLSRFFESDGNGYIKDPLPYSGPDPNGEETSIVNTSIPANEWKTFLPEIPGDEIYNILYGQKYKEGTRKILSFKGLSNGLETQLVFKKKKGNWQLVKLNAY